MYPGEMPVACTIAGSDSSGGAGIQADLKTFTALGVWGCTVIAAITAQNPREVRGSWILSPDVVRLQLESVIDEFHIAAFKTGMLGDARTIEVVVETLPRKTPLVVDPVMVSTSGFSLLDAGGAPVLRDALLPRATLLTPNIPEACAIAGVSSITTTDGMIGAANRIREMGVDAVLVKGGHLSGPESVDVLVDGDGVLLLAGTRHPYQVHGSGCSFSAAVAAYIARGEPLREACLHAKTFITASIRNAKVSGSGLFMVHPGKPEE